MQIFLLLISSLYVETSFELTVMSLSITDVSVYVSIEDAGDVPFIDANINVVLALYFGVTKLKV